MYVSYLFSFACTFAIHLLATDAQQFIHTYASNHLYTFCFPFSLPPLSLSDSLAVSLTLSVCREKTKKDGKTQQTAELAHSRWCKLRWHILRCAAESKWMAKCLAKTFQIITVVYSGRTVAFLSLPNQPVKCTRRNTHTKRMAPPAASQTAHTHTH